MGITRRAEDVRLLRSNSLLTGKFDRFGHLAAAASLGSRANSAAGASCPKASSRTSSGFGRSAGANPMARSWQAAPTNSIRTRSTNAYGCVIYHRDWRTARHCHRQRDIANRQELISEAANRPIRKPPKASVGYLIMMAVFGFMILLPLILMMVFRP